MLKNRCSFIHRLSAENDEIQQIYWRAEQKCRKFSKVIGITSIAYNQSIYVWALISSIYRILTGNTDASTWPVLVELSVPFDTNTIYGWYLLLVLLICTDLAYFASLILGTTQFVGSCIYIAAICEHFDEIMQTVQANIEKYRNEKDPWEYKKLRANINSQIHKAVRIHSGIYE